MPYTIASVVALAPVNDGSTNLGGAAGIIFLSFDSNLWVLLGEGSKYDRSCNQFFATGFTLLICFATIVLSQASFSAFRIIRIVMDALSADIIEQQHRSRVSLRLAASTLAFVLVFFANLYQGKRAHFSVNCINYAIGLLLSSLLVDTTPKPFDTLEEMAKMIRTGCAETLASARLSPVLAYLCREVLLCRMQSVVLHNVHDSFVVYVLLSRHFHRSRRHDATAARGERLSWHAALQALAAQHLRHLR